MAYIIIIIIIIILILFQTVMMLPHMMKFHTAYGRYEVILRLILGEMEKSLGPSLFHNLTNAYN